MFTAEQKACRAQIKIRNHHEGDSGFVIPADRRRIPACFYFFCTYLRQSMVTADRIMIPEKTNCRFVSTPRIVSE